MGDLRSTLVVGGHGPHQRGAFRRPGGEIRARPWKAAGHGPHHGERAARGEGSGDPACGDRPRGRRGARRRFPGSRRHPPDSHKGLLRQPERPHRGIDARGEERRAPPRATESPRWSLPTRASREATCSPGTARGVVVNTGARTYFGAITRKLAGQRSQTSFDKGISGFTWLMIRFMVIMVADRVPHHRPHEAQLDGRAPLRALAWPSG